MRPYRLAAAAVVVAALGSVVASPAGATPSASEYSGMTVGGGPTDLALGTDGNVWFTESDNPGGVGRITPSGAIAEYSDAAGVSKDGGPNRITAGPGGVWFTLTAKGRIDRVTSVGGVTEFDVGAKEKPTGITAGPDGNLWYTAQNGTDSIGQMTPSGTVRRFAAGLTANSEPGEIVRGGDGNLWFAEGAAGRIGRVTPEGAITEFPTGALTPPRDVTLGPDGDLWFTEAGTTPAIARMTRTGVVTRFPVAVANSAPLEIVTGGDGNLYFTDPGAGMIGRITPGGTITPYHAAPAADLRDLVTGSDGALWVASHAKDSITRLTVAPLSGSATTSDVDESSAQLTGVLRPNSEATTVFFEWGTTTAYGRRTAPQSVAMTGAQRHVSASLTQLAADTTYHVRLVSSNATGTSYGPDRTFSTPAANAPTATTGAASDAGPTGAVLSPVVNPRSHATTAHFEWGPTTDYGAGSAGAEVGDDDTDHDLAQPITGLEPNTTYHYRVVARSDVDTTLGADETFTTATVPPDATTDAAGDVTGGSARLAGRINPRNDATTFRFEWGPSADLGNVTGSDTLADTDNQPHAVAAALAGLEPNTTYYFRLVAGGEAGATYGAVETFTTAVVLPRAVTTAADGVSTTGATLAGTVDPRRAPVTHWFEWGTSTAYGNTTPAGPLAEPGTIPRPVEARIEGLAPGVTYHYRLVARSAAGEAAGEDREFTTATDPVPVAAEPLPTDPASPSDVPQQPETPGSGPAPVPAFGRSVAASVVSGTVRVRLPGQGYVALDGASSVPNGALVDARKGTLNVVSALDDAGHTQRATFRGARFTITQARSGRGMVDIRLHEAPTGCRTAAAVARTSAKRKKPPTLWAKDRHGKFRTHGRNSVATVRGTVWSTTETCAGTRTTVERGKVAVVSRTTHRRVLVRAGHSFLARAAR